MDITQEDMASIRYAKSLLESESFAVKVTNVIGTPIEKGIKYLPQKANKAIESATKNALNISLKVAVMTMSKESSSSWDKAHKLACAASGAIGGFFGMAALAVELPCTTTIMLRSIADIARSEGEMIASAQTEVQCISIFALGGSSHSDDAAETGYYAVRVALANTAAEAAKHITNEGLKKEGAPMVVKFISEIASRFGMQVTKKAAAQAIPVIGGVSGALINTIFIDHFQDKARGHFIVRRLERKYGEDLVKAAYDRCGLR